jgi:hypothetical protein
MSLRRAARSLIILSLYSATIPNAAQTQPLVGNPFISPTQNWLDAFPPPTRAGNWRLSLHNPALMDTNNTNPPTAGAVNNTGTHEPDVLIKNTFMAGQRRPSG